MNIYLSTDITDGKKSAKHHNWELVARSVPESQVRALEQAEDRFDAAEHRGKLPLGLRIVQYAAGFCTFILVISLLRSEVSVEQAFRNAPWLFYILGVTAPIWGILTLWARLKKRKNDASEEAIVADSRLYTTQEISFSMLDVPEDAPAVDVLVGRYKHKNGEVKILGVSDNVMLNPQYRVFVQQGKLCLVDIHDRHEIDLAAITGIRTFKKQVRIMNWNKELHFSADKFKPYKLVSNQYGIYLKSYHGLTFRHGDEDWMLLFPPYELPVFAQLTGKTASTV